MVSAIVDLARPYTPLHLDHLGAISEPLRTAEALVGLN